MCGAFPQGHRPELFLLQQSARRRLASDQVQPLAAGIARGGMSEAKRELFQPQRRQSFRACENRETVQSGQTAPPRAQLLDVARVLLVQLRATLIQETTVTRASSYAGATVILCGIVLLTAQCCRWVALPSFGLALLCALAWRDAEREERDA